MTSYRLPTFVCILITCFLLPTITFGQDGWVYYNHAPLGPNTNRITYLPPEGVIGQERAGDPPRPFFIRSKSKVCFVVRNANPLLYNYNISSKVVVAEEQEDVTKFLADLQPLLSLAGVAAKGVATFEDYDNNLINKIAEKQTELEKLRLDSDKEADLTLTVQKINFLLDSINIYTGKANTLYSALKPQEKKDVSSLRAYQLIVEDRVKLISNDVSLASSYLSSNYTLCVPVGTDRIKVILSASRKIKTENDVSAKRPVDSLAMFEVQPLLTNRVRVVPSLLFGVPIGKNVASYALEDGIITSQAVEPYFFLPLTLQFRAGLTPLWGTLGLRTRGLDKIPDLFLGLVYDFGEVIGGKTPSMTLGAGVTYIQTTVGLTKGAKVGEALPSGVTKIDDVLNQKHQLGIGFTFTISKLKLSGK